MRVNVVEPTGSETQGLGFIGAHVVTRVFLERVSAQPEEIITVRPNRAHVHLFGPDGARI